MKILFVHCANFLESTIPEGVALLSSILKEHGHQVEVFDTAFLKPKNYSIDKKKDEKKKRWIYAIALYKETAYNLEDLVADQPEVDIVEKFYEKIKEFQPSLIAVSAMSRNYRKSLNLIKAVNPTCKVAFGGVHPTLMPEDVVTEKGVDFVCVGEGDMALVELCDSLENARDPSRINNLYVKLKEGKPEKIIKNSLGPFVDLNLLPAPDLGIFDSRHLFRPFLGNIYKGIFMSTARGCPRGCFYCVNNRLRTLFKECGQEYLRFQSPKVIARHVEFVKNEYGINWIKFSDDTFLLRQLEEIYELRDLLQPLNIMFGCSVDPVTVSSEKVKALREAGCVSMTIGIETGNQRIRKEVIGRQISDTQIKKAIHIIRDYGIKISSFNIVGLPGETREDFFQTIRLNKELEIPDANLYILYPFPGSKIFEDSGVTLDKYDYERTVPGFNLSKMRKEELSYFLSVFNLYLVLPESYWGKIEAAETNPKLYRDLVKIAQDIVNAR